MDAVLSIDAGTSSVRVCKIDEMGIVLSASQREVVTTSSSQERMEQDPSQIFSAILACISDVTRGDGGDIMAVGIANQRESFVLVDPENSKELTPLILWQDRRSEAKCNQLRELGLEERVRELTGLPIDPYFSATKLAAVMEENPNLASRSPMFMTLDSYIIYRLSGGRLHLTDPSNASRTMLFDTSRLAFDAELADIFSISDVRFPEVVPSFGEFAVISSEVIPHLGGVKITGSLGDQQASLLGQACTKRYMAKNTYGTGSFLLCNVGKERTIGSVGLLSSIGWQDKDLSLTHVIEGAVYSSGSILKWMRDSLGLFTSYQEATELAGEVSDSMGVTVVPSFEGLGSPYFEATSGAAIFGLSQTTTKAHLIRGAIEAMAHRTQDVVVAIEAALGHTLDELRVDGGASVIDLLCQFQADQLGIAVSRSRRVESTAFGAGIAALYGCGSLSNLEEVERLHQVDRVFEPTKSKRGPDQRRTLWKERLQRVRNS